MMPSGFFLGGMAEGAETANRQALAEQTLRDDTALRSRAIQLQERQFGNVQNQQAVERGDKLIADTMAHVAETVKQATTVGRDPASVLRAVQPLVDSAKAVAARVGRDPNSLDAQVRALITNPGAVESATVAGTAAATQAVAQDTAERNLLRAQQPPGAEGSADPELQRRYKTAQEKTSAENGLRDDFVKNSKEFLTVRDNVMNFKQAENSGAGDIVRVFAFMKIQDPGSTVREGEYATASNAAGVPEGIRAMYNKLVGGGVLSEEARKQVSSQVDRLYQSRLAQHDSLQTQFAGIAKRQGLNPNNVVVNFGMVNVPQPAAADTPLPRARPQMPEIPAPPPGFILNGR